VVILSDRVTVSRVSVVIPVRDGARTLAACLDAIAGQRPVRDVAVEVIVVDNGSTDATADLAARHPAVSRVVTERRPGSYAARNAGLAAATGDLIAFTDADCVPAPNWLHTGVAAVVAGHGDLVAGHVTPRVRADPSIWERFDAGHHVDQRKYVEILGFGATANLFVRRLVLDGVGAFDGAMGSGGDRELCRRAVVAGFQLAYAPEAEVVHGSRRTALETWRLHRRLGAGLRQLHERGLQPPWWRDDQMLLPLGWAAQVASDDTRRYRHRELLPLATLVVAARATGRMTGR
jgi:glycosyltransferase involved in cell wall biosynthesis